MIGVLFVWMVLMITLFAVVTQPDCECPECRRFREEHGG